MMKKKQHLKEVDELMEYIYELTNELMATRKECDLAERTLVIAENALNYKESVIDKAHAKIGELIMEREA